MRSHHRSASSGSEYSDYFQEVNERPVGDISFQSFYKPHTLTLLAISLGSISYMAFTRDDDISYQDNLWAGLRCIFFFFMFISVLTFPNGPFIRPHPALWRLVFGCSVAYLLFILFVLFQDYATVRSMIVYFHPHLANYTIDMDPDNWGRNCNPVTLQKVWDHLDIFAFGHLTGWMMKALVLRHYGLLWTISVLWEITELLFAHLLPNFVECWWDALLLDVLLCNGLGIYIGMQICRFMEMRQYKWESIKDISSATGKVKRALLQFTPETFSHTRWLDPGSSYMRVLAVSLLVVLWQLTELNTFFLKHIFQLPSENALNPLRLLFIGVVVAPSIRQYYCFVTDRRCGRIGTQCWVYICIAVTEALVCFKFGRELFKQTVVANVLGWLAIQMAVSLVCVYVCVVWSQHTHRRYHQEVQRGNDSGLELETSVPLDSPTRRAGSTLRHRIKQSGGDLDSSLSGSPVRRSVRLAASTFTS